MRKVLRFTAVCAAFAAVLSVSACAGLKSTDAAKSVGKYVPGTYSGTDAGFGGALEVQVTVDANKILKVVIVANKETAGIGSKAVEALPSAIVEKQTADVEAVAGATMASDAIKAAVKNALSKASPAALKSAGAKDGTYKAKVYGNNDYLSVEVVIKDGKIASVNVPSHSETKFLGAAVIPKLSALVVKYQTVAVDSVAGATVTSVALKSAVADCLKQAGASGEFRTPMPAQGVKKEGVTKRKADVIVVGAGGSGLMAAATAAEKGAKVIVIEKMPVVGGNTLRCASAYNTADPARQAALPMTETLNAAVRKALAEKPANDAHKQLIADVQAKYDAYLASGSKTLFDCPEWHALQTYLGGDKVGEVPLIRFYAEHTLETLDWLIKYGLPVDKSVSQGAGALWQRTHQVNAPAGTGLVTTVYDRAVALGVEIVTEMKAEELAKDAAGKVRFVKAVDAYGSAYEFEAAKGVVLATGGFSRNVEMRMKYNPRLTADMVSTNQPGATGDGIVMAQKLNAGLTGMEYIQVYPLATPGSGALQGRARYESGLDNVIDVNKLGKRFVNEDARRDDFVVAINKQSGGVVYDINDSTIVKTKNSFDEDVQTLVAIGRIYKADTLAGLEKQIGMPSGSLEATVAEYNKMAAAKSDPVFGRKLFAGQIAVPPFYATPRAPSIHHTMGGLAINTRTQVLDVGGQAIPGLYACGEVTGGIHGSNRLGGNATADAMSFGHVAGAAVLAD